MREQWDGVDAMDEFTFMLQHDGYDLVRCSRIDDSEQNEESPPVALSDAEFQGWIDLTAAAPAMLAALKWALCHVRFSGGPEGDAETFSANYNAAQSAIAQAKGEK